MYISNGIVYADERAESIKIRSARVLENSIILVTFATGETRLFDATVLSGGVFERLKDESLLRQIEIDHGVMTWDDGAIDCSPEYVYKNSYDYISPEQADCLAV